MPPIYELQIKPSSPRMWDLTADVIFGHLCWMIKYELGEDTLVDFLKQMTESPIFTISDILPTWKFPRPLTQYDWDSRDWDENDIKTNKKYKEMKYIERGIFENNFVWRDLSKKEKIWEIKWNIKNENTHNNIKINSTIKNVIDRNTWTTWENSLYSLEEAFTQNSLDTFSLFLKIHKSDSFISEDQIKNLIKKVFELWIGKKKSTGKGVFEIKQDWTLQENIEKSGWNYQILLSNCIPSAQDPTNWAYSISTKFGKMSEEYSIAGRNFHKKPVIFIEKWSCFPNDKKWYMWKMIQNIAIQQKWIYQYGYGFTISF